MTPAVVGQVIAHANKLFGLDPMVEITAEANPTSIEAGRMLAFRHTGVNRISMGVQSLDDKVLAFLGREHSAIEAQHALDTIRTAFDHISIDLIYATPGQTKACWRQQLGHALAFDLTHLSLYQLTIEPGTVFYSRQRRGEVMTLNDDRAAALYNITQEMTGMAGLPAYEISNHAKPGFECQHNLTYWQGGDWLGIGPGHMVASLTIGGMIPARRAVPPVLVAARQGGFRRCSAMDMALKKCMMRDLLTGLPKWL